MSSAQNQFPQRHKPTSSESSADVKSDAQETLASESMPPAETHMDQYLDSSPSMTSSASPLSSDPMSSTVSADSDPAPEDAMSSNSPLPTGQPVPARQQPIPPASEPMQYRAIGLVRGTYTPSEEQFTRGLLLTEDGTTLDAVLLGRVMSLVKKHLDLEKPHLWVVYPRTRSKASDLHLQIVGVWEPENLNRGLDQPDEGDATEEEVPDLAPPEGVASTDDIDDNYFSIRGEIIFQVQEQEQLFVKIQQAPRRPSEYPKSFKLALKGTVEGKAVGYFWDLNVKREDRELVVKDGTMIAAVPPKKRGPGPRRSGPGGGGRRPGGNRRFGAPSAPRRTSDRPQAAPQEKREFSKPVKKRPTDQSSDPSNQS